MKKKILKLLSILIVPVLCLAGLTACVNTGGEEEKVESITVAPADLTLMVGGVEHYSAVVLPSSSTAKITWNSSNKSVATVSTDGVVTCLEVGETVISATAGGVTGYADLEVIAFELLKPDFPSFKPVGYTIEMDDYKNKTAKEEFQFPTVIDASLHLDNPIHRYYLFYAPHDNPGGIYLSTSDSLNGPWTEYGDGPLVTRAMTNPDDPTKKYDVSHISAQDVVWNDYYDCYFMYFHGENTTTRYATSPDLVNWSYRDVVLVAKDFHDSGNEASYGRVFEHTIPGLNNRYIMLLMINTSDNVRQIYYAHSLDGVNWTPVRNVLLHADQDLAPAGTTYNATGTANMTGQNLSGPFFHKIQTRYGTRYCITAHASSGNVYLFEVGQAFDQEIHWGIVHDSDDRLDAGTSSNPNYEYARSSAPYYIQDDDGTWHMFYEGGLRLHANIVHAVEIKD